MSKDAKKLRRIMRQYCRTLKATTRCLKQMLANEKKFAHTIARIRSRHR